MNRLERSKGCLLGLAVGDAIGTTVEFLPRGTFKPVVTMTGGGMFMLDCGKWTDDTSMALCLGESLLENKGFDAVDQMKKYTDWHENGYMSSTGTCFDIGNATRKALDCFNNPTKPHHKNGFCGNTSKWSSGNGCLMRLAPIPIFYSRLENLDKYAAESSMTTHASSLCLGATIYFANMLNLALLGNSKQVVLDCEQHTPSLAELKRIARGDYKTKHIDHIKGSGYVVEALEAALWCFYKTDNFRDCVLMAANLGDDADTTAAIVGQLAGAYYGIDGIPLEWLDKLYMGDEIEDMAVKLAIQNT